MPTAAAKSYTPMADDRTAAPHVVIHEDERSRSVSHPTVDSEPAGIEHHSHT